MLIALLDCFQELEHSPDCYEYLISRGPRFNHHSAGCEGSIGVVSTSAFVFDPCDMYESILVVANVALVVC